MDVVIFSQITLKYDTILIFPLKLEKKHTEKNLGRIFLYN